MCLVTKNPEIKIAEKPVFCYKNGFFSGIRTFSPGFIPEYEYKIGENQPNVELRPWQDPLTRDFEVEEGYHSWNTKELAVAHHCYGEEQALFVIPKGAVYIDGYFGSHEDWLNRVSSTIVCLGRVDSPITWLRVLYYKLKSKLI